MKLTLCAFLGLLISTPLSAQLPATDCTAAQQRLESAEQRLQDWPQLSRYAAANAALLAPGAEEKRVVFFGDSITDIWNLEQSFPGKRYVNRGIGGQTTPQLLLRMRADVIALRPRAVVILAGTNDIAKNTGPMTLEMTEDNFRSLAELAGANHIKVIFSSVMPVSDYGPRPMTDRRPPGKILALNAWLKAYCQAGNCTYLDYFSSMVDDKGFLRPELSGDGLHPNAAGYKLMAPLAETAIRKVVK